MTNLRHETYVGVPGCFQSIGATHSEDLWGLTFYDRTEKPLDDQDEICEALGVPLECPWNGVELYVKTIGIGFKIDGPFLTPVDSGEIGFYPLKAAEEIAGLVLHRRDDDSDSVRIARAYQQARDEDTYYYQHPMVHAFLEWPGAIPERKYELCPEDLPDEPEPPTRQKPLLADLSDILRNPTEPEFLIDGVFELNTTNALVGPSGSGKSFTAIDVLLSVSTGRPWAGHEIKRPGPVVYVVGEGLPAIPRRVQAWLHDAGIELPPGRFFMTQAGIEVDEAGARRLTTEIEQIAVEHGKPVMLAFDTVARVMPGDSDENSAKDTMSFVGLVDRLRDRFGCVVLLVNHVGHSEETRLRARGSSAFGGAMDSIIVMDPRRNHLVWTKTKDSEPPEPLSYSLAPCAPSAVMRYGTEASPPVATTSDTKKLGKAEQLGLDTLNRVCQETRQSFAGLGPWRFEFFRSHWADGVDAKRKAFARAREGLVGANLVRVEDDTYSIVTPDKTKNVRDCPDNVRGVERTDTDTPLRGCPVVRTLSASEVQVFGDEDFVGGSP